VGTIPVSTAEFAAHAVGVGAASDDHRFTDVGTAATVKGAAANDGRQQCFTLARILEKILRRRAMFYDSSIAFAPFSR